MKIAKIFKLGQKGAKKVKKIQRRRRAGGRVAGRDEGRGLRARELGQDGVLHGALHAEQDHRTNFHVSVRDNATANEFFRNDMAIKGVDVDSGGTGTIAAKSVPKRFPDHTVKDVLLQFTAILDGGAKIPVVTYDYNGKAASISERSDEAENIRSFMADADGLLFFFDPKILGADPEVQARVSSFVNILELVVSLKSRLPIPVGLVITKADTLPGYSGEEKTILIRAEDEQVIAEDYETFLEQVLGFESLSDDREWASSVRNSSGEAPGIHQGGRGKNARFPDLLRVQHGKQAREDRRRGRTLSTRRRTRSIRAGSRSRSAGSSIRSSEAGG